MKTFDLRSAFTILFIEISPGPDLQIVEVFGLTSFRFLSLDCCEQRKKKTAITRGHGKVRSPPPWAQTGHQIPSQPTRRLPSRTTLCALHLAGDYCGDGGVGDGNGDIAVDTHCTPNLEDGVVKHQEVPVDEDFAKIRAALAWAKVQPVGSKQFLTAHSLYLRYRSRNNLPPTPPPLPPLPCSAGAVTHRLVHRALC
jgi:hypothetical protein